MTRCYITVSIPYVNAAPHVGYALELVEADALARHRRDRGDEVRFLGGTDDHAIKNALAADAAGIPTRAFVDANAARFEALREPLDISLDDFIRTSRDERHAPGVRRLWELTRANGDFCRSTYGGLYCGGCEQYFTEDEVPDRRCPEHEADLEVIAEENWFFRLSRYTDRILDALETGRIRIVPEVFANEAIAYVRRGLEDISVSRPIDRARGWGVPVPDDPTQVVYVWWEALANYVTALGFGSSTEQATNDAFRRWWVESDERIHVIGKGILRFHAVYWPALLLSAGLPLPTTIYVHPYLTAGGRKISKSTGNVVDPTDVVARHGTDALRWWLLADVPRAADADFSDERLAQRVDTDLANGIGNVVHRVLTMIQRFRDGRPPAQGRAAGPRPPAAGVVEAFDRFDFRAVVGAALGVVRTANETVEHTAPWALARKEREGDEAAGAELDAVLHRLLANLDGLEQLIRPLVPATAARLRALLTPGDDGRLPAPVPLHERS